MKAREDSRKTPDWKLERYLLGELPADEMDFIRAELERDPRLPPRLDALKRSDEEIRARYPADSMSRQIRGKVEGPAGRDTPARPDLFSRLWPMPALPIAAVLIALGILPILFGPEHQPEAPSQILTTRVKGLEPSLILFRKTVSGTERLENGATAREGDLIMIHYQSAGREYGAIVSVDGRGKVTRHLPLEGAEAARLHKGEPASLDFAYELDDAPWWETFFFVTSESTFEVEPVITAARRLALRRLVAEQPASTRVGGQPPAAPTEETAADSSKLPDASELPGEREFPDSLALPGALEQFAFTLRKEAGHE
jgi:hypothetical protein